MYTTYRLSGAFVRSIILFNVKTNFILAHYTFYKPCLATTGNEQQTLSMQDIDDQQDRHIYRLLAEPPNIVRMLELVQIPTKCMLKHATKHH